MKIPTLTFKYGNMLQINGEFLDVRAGCLVERFAEVVHLGESAIRQAIDAQHVKQQNKNPNLTIQRCSIWLIAMADTEEDVVSTEAIIAQQTKQSNRGIYDDTTLVRDIYRPYWEVVEHTGLQPEGRFNSGTLGNNGFWLLARAIPLF